LVEYAGESVTVRILIGFDQDNRPHYEHLAGKLRKYDADEGAFIIQQKGENTFETFIPTARIVDISPGRKPYRYY